MIQKEKSFPLLDISDESAYSIEMFVMENRSMCAIGMSKSIVIIDPKSGKLLQRVKLREVETERFGYGLIVLLDIFEIRCLITEIKGCLMLVHYEDNFRVERLVTYDGPKDESLDISNGRNVIAKVDKERICYINDDRFNIIFFNIHARKIVKDISMKPHLHDDDDPTELHNLDEVQIEYDMNPHLLFITDDSYSLYIMDVKTYEILSKVKVDDISFDFSGKYTICIGQPTKTTFGLRKFDRCLKGEDPQILSTEIDIIIDERGGNNYVFNPSYFACKYVFGEDFVLGTDSFNMFFSDDPGDCAVLGAYKNQKDWEILDTFQRHQSPRFCVKNRGRDIFFILRQNNVSNFLHYRNHSVNVMIDIDPDEIERMEYVKDMMNEEVLVMMKIVCPFISFLCLKSLFV